MIFFLSSLLISESNYEDTNVELITRKSLQASHIKQRRPCSWDSLSCILFTQPVYLPFFSQMIKLLAPLNIWKSVLLCIIFTEHVCTREELRVKHHKSSRRHRFINSEWFALKASGDLLVVKLLSCKRKKKIVSFFGNI